MIRARNAAPPTLPRSLEIRLHETAPPRRALIAQDMSSWDGCPWCDLAIARPSTPRNPPPLLENPLLTVVSHCPPAYARIGATRRPFRGVRREPGLLHCPPFGEAAKRLGGRVCGSSGLQGRTYVGTFNPPHRGAAYVARHTHSDGAALARGKRIRAVCSTHRGPSTGGIPRSIPRLLASPLPSSTFGAPRASVEAGAERRGPRGPYDRGAPHA
jgi:hypothetical protein